MAKSKVFTRDYLVSHRRVMRYVIVFPIDTACTYHETQYKRVHQLYHVTRYLVRHVLFNFTCNDGQVCYFTFAFDSVQSNVANFLHVQAYFLCPATDTKLIQYLFPLRSGRLCPKWVPSTETVSPSGSTRT